MNHLSLVEAEIARLRAELDAINRRLAEFVATRAVLLELAAAAAEAGDQPAGKGKPGRPPNKRLALDIARLLAGGPLSNAELSRATGSHDSHTYRAMARRPEWFRRLGGPKRGAKWELTPEGRKAAAAPSPAA